MSWEIFSQDNVRSKLGERIFFEHSEMNIPACMFLSTLLVHVTSLEILKISGTDSNSDWVIDVGIVVAQSNRCPQLISASVIGLSIVEL